MGREVRAPCWGPFSDAVFCTGAALGPLLAGLISPTGWNNVFYMLISADILACLVRVLGGTQMGIGAGERPVVQAGPLEVQSIGHEGLWDNENSCPTLRTTFFPWVNSRQMKLCAHDPPSWSPPPLRHPALGTDHVVNANVALPSLCASNSPQLLCRLVYKEIIAWKSSPSRDRG